VTAWVGIDPDSNATGIAFLGDDNKVVSAGVVRAHGSAPFFRVASILSQFEAVAMDGPRVTGGAIEVMQHYKGSPVNPNNLMLLNLIAGGAKVCFPLAKLSKPGEWKGQIPKTVHHRRILKIVGNDWRNEDVVFGDPAKGNHWKEVYDAIGLALWAKGAMR